MSFSCVHTAFDIVTDIISATGIRSPMLSIAVFEVQTVALLNIAGPDGAKAGLALGTVTSAALIALYLKRALDTGETCCTCFFTTPALLQFTTHW